MKRKYLVFGFITLGFQLSSFCAEVDSFTHRLEPLEDSLTKVNRNFNEHLQRGLVTANILNKHLQRPQYRDNSLEDTCDERALYYGLREFLGNQYLSEFGEHITDAVGYDAHRSKIPTSIYRRLNFFDSPVQGNPISRNLNDPTAATLNVNGVLLGTDKFEHFLGSGFNYFKRNYLHRRGLQSALDIGNRAESGILGSMTTGVKSFGDLSANFNGMRFWNHILQKNTDILGPEFNEGPYVSCENSKWVQVKRVDFSVYVDDSFDESINCSSFSSKNVLEKVLAEISILEDDTGVPHTCPIDTDNIPALKKKYGKIGDQILNFDKNRVMLD